MTTPEHLEDVGRWLRFASEDISVAEELERIDGIARVRYFQAQQAAEKAIKSVLVHLQIEFEKTHDLVSLAHLLPPEWTLHCEPSDLPELSVWAVKSRYPGDWADATEHDAVRAVKIARAIVDRVLDHFVARALCP